MESLPLELEKLRQDQGLTNLQFAEKLGLDHTVTSRLCAGKKGVSHGLMARLLVNLGPEEAKGLLQAYFNDEMKRIMDGRAEKAHELGVRLPKKPWTFTVTVDAEG